MTLITSQNPGFPPALLLAGARALATKILRCTGRGRSTAMDWVPTKTHSFIVKIWLEQSAEEAGEAKWRGHITHIPSGTRRYMESLDVIAVFITPYLKSMGVKLGFYSQIKQWLSKRE